MDQNSVDSIREKIVESLGDAEEVQTDSGRVKNQSVSQKIKAIDYLTRLSAINEQERGQVGRVGIRKIRNRD